MGAVTIATDATLKLNFSLLSCFNFYLLFYHCCTIFSNTMIIQNLISAKFKYVCETFISSLCVF
jgi:hypothetical protein